MPGRGIGLCVFRRLRRLTLTLVCAAKDERQMGSLIEAGAALAAGKQIYLISPTIGLGGIMNEFGALLV
jgi:hypothetical protein